MSTSYRRCCGIDVHKKSVTVHVLPPQGQTGSETVGAGVPNLFAGAAPLAGLVETLSGFGSGDGIDWAVLARGVECVGRGDPRLVLVNPQHVKALAGRKTDRIDSRRLARYLENHDLQGSFVPTREIRELRDLTRSRVHLLEEVNRVKNRIGQLCEAGNIKVSSVASDLFGVSGRRMLEAVAEGKRDAGWMAD